MVLKRFDEIVAGIVHKEFQKIDVDKTFENTNLYSGIEQMQELDLASRISLAEAGRTTHQLKQKTIAERLDKSSAGPDLAIVTISSARDLVPIAQPPQFSARHPFYLGAGEGASRAKGFFVNTSAKLEKQYKQALWIQRNQDAIEIALKRKANIICMGEFDFPPINNSTDAARKASLAANRDHREWISKRLSEEGRAVFLFAGSSHSWNFRKSNCANIGRIFIADLKPKSETTFVRFQRYEKRVSARSLGESLATVPSYRLPYFGTSIAKIGVLICVDAFDPAIVMSVFANSADDNFNRMGVILVPSYNTSHRLVRSCQQLSYLANCTVVYVNAFANAHHQRAQVFVSGISLDTWKAQLDNVTSMVEARNLPDPRMVESIPGVRSWALLARMADAARGIQIEPAARGQDQVMYWKIPQVFITTAQQKMSDKYPFDRGRVIASLPTILSN